MNQKSLALLLSKLKTFDKPDVSLEQYQTDSEIAAQAIWHIYMNKNIENKTIADLGCGNGILGLASLILGAKKVYFIDKDKTSINIAKQNKKFLEKELKINLNAEFINIDIKDFNKKVNLIIQNPPFGVKKTHTDKKFLSKAMSLTSLIYSFHKIESENFIKAFTKDNDFHSKLLFEINFPLKKTLIFHKKKTHFVKVGFWKISKD